MKIDEDFQLTADGLLTFADNIYAPQPSVRRLKDAADVLYESVPLSDRPLYYMYRGVHYREDRSLFLDNDIRYDITVILPGLVGHEYIKTVGHFHPLKPQSSETYPEYYEVLEGEALYILQKNNRAGEVEEIMAIEAKKGDKVFIPPNYGHITVNPGERPLVMANLIESNFSSLYQPFADKRGAAYYCIKGENGKREFVKNENYHNSVGLKLMAAPSLEQPLDLDLDKGLYQWFKENPEAFSILK
ncbi:MAG: glucose-6-phosphate isomerase [Thermoanaerobacteraceae bacterium]|nr:glucose-6-phosphate isomerase [Thermoanaerobacteraceae bacterium]